MVTQTQEKEIQVQPEPPELARTTIVLPLETQLQGSRLQLLQAASMKLGYRRHARVVAEQRASHVHREEFAKLKAAFEKVGVDPFAKKNVERYKAKKIHQADRKYWLRNYVNSPFGQGAMFLGGAGGVLLAAGSLIVEGIAVDGTKLTFGQWYPQIIHPLFSAGLVGIAYWLSSAFLRNIVFDRRRFTHKWEGTDIPNYSGQIPYFALSHAVELAGELGVGGENFSVETITADFTDASRFSFDPDPFLVLTYAGERFYIDVWDERDFEREN